MPQHGSREFESLLASFLTSFLTPELSSLLDALTMNDSEVYARLEARFGGAPRFGVLGESFKRFLCPGHDRILSRE